MTTNDLAAIRARAEAATPGPWVTRSLTELYDGNYDGPPGSNLWLATEWEDAKGPNLGADEMLNHDAEFVAAARTDVPLLCDEVEALRQELKVTHHSWDVEIETSHRLDAEMEALREYAALKHAEYLALWRDEEDESKSEYWDGVAAAYKDIHDRLALRDAEREE